MASTLSKIRFRWVPILRITQAILGLAVLGLTAYMVSWFSFSPIVNFMLFTSCWTPFVAVPFLATAPMYFTKFSTRLVALAMEIITTIFWLAGFIALATLLPPPDQCYDSCESAQAAVVIGAVEWAVFVASTALTTIRFLSFKENNNEQEPAQNDSNQPEAEMSTAAV